MHLILKKITYIIFFYIQYILLILLLNFFLILITTEKDLKILKIIYFFSYIFELIFPFFIYY